MEKKAKRLTGFQPLGGIDAAFIGMDVANSVGEVSKEFKGGQNKYDQILGNKITKTPKHSAGSINAVNSNPLLREASDLIDTMYMEKVAEGTRSTGEFEYLYGNEEPKKPKNVYPYAAIGTILALAGVDHAVGGDVGKSVVKALKNLGYKYPQQMLKRTKGGKLLVNTVRTATKELPKVASEIIDDCYEEEIKKNYEIEKEAKAKKFKWRGSHLRKMLIEDLLQRGIVTSVPATAASMGVSYAVTKGIRRQDNLEKRAYSVEPPKYWLTKSWKNYLKYDVPERTMQAIGKSIFPATVVAISESRSRRKKKKSDSKKMRKRASDLIDEMFEKDAGTKVMSDAEKDIEKIIKNVSKDDTERGRKKMMNYRAIFGQTKRQKLLR